MTTTPPLRTSRYSDASIDLVGVATAVEVATVWVTGVVMVVGVMEREVSMAKEVSTRPGGVITSLQEPLCVSNVSLGTSFLHLEHSPHVSNC